MNFNFDINLILLPLLALMAIVWLVEAIIARFFPRLIAGRTKVPWWLDYSRSFLPVLAIVVVIRSFIAEPYQIPSSSMTPTLLKGDFILVNKFHYGIRLPLTNEEIIKIHSLRRGDVLVFRFPHNQRLRYIKRVVGLPGDRIAYINQALYVNGEEISRQAYLNNFEYAEFYESLRSGETHTIRSYHLASPISAEWVVPANHYFVLGDNRDNSNDSRYWGFVPHSQVVGKAFYIWMHWEGWSSLPSFRRNSKIR